MRIKSKSSFPCPGCFACHLCRTRRRTHTPSATATASGPELFEFPRGICCHGSALEPGTYQHGRQDLVFYLEAPAADFDAFAADAQAILATLTVVE